MLTSVGLTFIGSILRNSLVYQFHYKMNELKSSVLESKVNTIYLKVKNIKQQLQEVKLELITLVNSEEYSEIKQFLRSKRNLEALDLNSLVLPITKKLKSHTEAGKSTTDGPYSYFNTERDRQSNSKRHSENNFIQEGDYVVVYTDGACENNGKVNAKAGIGVWFAENHPLNVSRPVEGKATNNTAEIQACVTALEILYREGIRSVRIKTDSQFTINCITKWIKKWKNNNWKVATGADVKNKEDLIKLDNIRNGMTHVDWIHIRAHQGEKGNEEADRLAKAGAFLYNKNLKGN